MPILIFLNKLVYLFVTNQLSVEREKLVSKSNSDDRLGAWLKVDEKDKKVYYQVDPSWMQNSSDEEQKNTLGILSLLADVYRRAGYAIIDIFKK